MTMRAVCREAELSQKFFYESFTDTDELLREVYRSTFEHARQVIAAAGDSTADLTSRTRAAWRRRHNSSETIPASVGSSW